MAKEKKVKEKKIKQKKRQGSLWQLVMIIAVLVLSILGMTGLLVKNSQSMVAQLTKLKSDDMKFQQQAEAAYNSFLSLDAKSNEWVGLGVGADRFGDDKLANDTQSAAQEGSVMLNDDLQELKKLAATQTEKDHIAKALTDMNDYMNFFQQVQQLNATDHHKAQQLQYVDSADASNFLSQDLQKILEDASSRVVNHSNVTLTDALFANQVNEYGGGFLVLLSLICLLVTWRTTNPIVKAVAKINGQLQRIAQGDLTDTELNVKARGEIGQLVQAVNQMTRDLRSVILHVKETAIQVASSSEQLNASAEMTNRASEEIAQTINEISSGSEQQVEVVESGHQVLERINEKIIRIADNAENVTNRAAEAAQVAAEGSQAVQSAVDQMHSINQTMEHLQNVIRGLGERSMQIGRIVEAITDIAGQTNLLALNAAIESARAGEQGRGFAVVADEVRKLAEQSTGSAQEIGKYIMQIQAEIQEAVQTMETSAHEVKSGTGVVNTVGESFERIQQTVEEVASQIRDVSAASLEMTTSTELTDTMGTIAAAAIANARGTQQASAVTEEQVATMQEIAASTAALSQLADELQDLVEKFQI